MAMIFRFIQKPSSDKIMVHDIHDLLFNLPFSKHWHGLVQLFETLPVLFDAWVSCVAAACFETAAGQIFSATAADAVRDSLERGAEHQN
jgi:hypothetical protein